MVTDDSHIPMVAVVSDIEKTENGHRTCLGMEQVPGPFAEPQELVTLGALCLWAVAAFSKRSATPLCGTAGA